MRKNMSGFTIIELLIVIVIIAILAAITLVAYNGVQVKARDSARSESVAQLQKALESYFVINGSYPTQNPVGSNVPSGFSPIYNTSSYAYSVDTAGNWMKNLTSSNIITNAPIDPINDNNHYFVYYASGGLFACTRPFYILVAYGYENPADIPPSSHDVNCSNSTYTAHWAPTSKMGVFSNI